MLCLSSFHFSLLSFLLNINPSLLYSLKNCTVGYSPNVINVSVLSADRALSAVPDDIPRNAQSLDLSSNQIVKIDKTDFSSLSKLVYLQMVLNSISHIDDGAFADLVELTDLDIRYNVLTNLTENIFQGLSKLVNLFLNKNKITQISPLAFQPLVSLQRVTLNGNELNQINEIASILQLPNLDKLEATANRFSSLESDKLSLNKSSVRTLLLELNLLTKFSITRDIFPNLQYLSMCAFSTDFEWNVSNKTFLRSLTSLLLCGIKISFETYRMILQSTEFLEYLWLPLVEECFGKNLIDVACQIPALTSLDLTCNEFNVVNDTLLQSCSKVTKLKLVGDVITNLSQNSLRSLNKIEHLELDSNFLVRVPLAIRGLSRLVVLSMFRNDIGELGCSDFLNLTRLTKLFLGNNRISTLRTCVFQDLKNLKSLGFDGNPLFNVHDSFRASLHNLKILSMKDNNIPTLSKGNFADLSSLLYLDMNSFSFCELENGSFEGLDSVETLILSPFTLREYMLKGLPQLKRLTVNLPVFMKKLTHRAHDNPFLNVPSLRELIIKHNTDMDIYPDVLRDLKYLQHFSAEKFFTGAPHPDTFIYTPQLTSLEIISSNISFLKPELFQPIPNLRALDLSKNKLRSLDFLTHVNLSALSLLKLSKNELTVINVTVFESLPALTYLDFYNNPFTCDCSNTGFIQWVKSNNQTQVVNTYQYNCVFPPSKQGTRLLDFDIQSCLTEPNFLCFIFTTCGVVLTLLTSFIYHFMRWQLAYGFYLFLAFLYNSRNKRKGDHHQYDAFISYNVQDEEWVYQEMLPVLEGEQGWRLCLHHRDFQPGKPIIENITDAIYGSRKTICVITRRYLQSEWCSREIQMASFRLFDERKDVLILLFLEEIPAHQLSPYYRMRKLVKKRTYLSWPQARQHSAVFWQNVRRALQTGESPTENTNLLTASLVQDYGT